MRIENLTNAERQTVAVSLERAADGLAGLSILAGVLAQAVTRTVEQPPADTVDAPGYELDGEWCRVAPGAHWPVARILERAGMSAETHDLLRMYDHNYPVFVSRRISAGGA